MANLTLTIDDELLQKARQRAVAEKTTVNALVRDYLTRYAEALDASRRERSQRAIALMSRIAAAMPETGGDPRIDREDLYDRPVLRR